jgi:hypothetical protein
MQCRQLDELPLPATRGNLFFESRRSRALGPGTVKRSERQPRGTTVPQGHHTRGRKSSYPNWSGRVSNGRLIFAARRPDHPVIVMEERRKPQTGTTVVNGIFSAWPAFVVAGRSSIEWDGELLVPSQASDEGSRIRALGHGWFGIGGPRLDADIKPGSDGSGPSPTRRGGRRAYTSWQDDGNPTGRSLWRSDAAGRGRSWCSIFLPGSRGFLGKSAPHPC